MFKTKNENKSYPLALIRSYAAHEISREQFINLFRSWQKSNGMNFDCKGTADKNGTFVTYRGVTAKIENGVLCWNNNTAKNLFEFQRKVDFSKNDYPILTVDQQKTLFEIMRARNESK